MTAICLKNKNAAKAETWSSVFSSLGTEAKSCLFMKQLTATCISTILHLRKILPDKYFQSKSFEGMTLNLLKPGSECVNKIEEWLEGAFEAIDKKYLKHLMLDIINADSNLTLEIYTMTFNYPKGKEKSNFTLSSNDSKESISELTISNTKAKTIRLLQMCQAVTQYYSNLPDKIILDFRLTYHDDTPPDYQPKGYKDYEPKAPIFPSAARSIEIGVTGTNHHFFKLVNKSCLNDDFFKVLKALFTTQKLFFTWLLRYENQLKRLATLTNYICSHFVEKNMKDVLFQVTKRNDRNLTTILFF